MENQTTMDTGEHTFLHAVALDDSLQDDLRRRFLFRRHLIMSSRFSSPGSLRRFHSQKFVLVLLCVLALITAGCSSGSAVTPLAPTSTVTSDEQAANGPLVGDTSKYASEQTCATNENNQPWYATITAFEHHDSNRSHVFACAEFLGTNSEGNNQVYAYTSPVNFPGAYNLVTGTSDALYVYGGGYGDAPNASGSYIARVETGSLKEMWRHVLINTNTTNEWNYPGTVLEQVTLPTGDSEPRDTAYNGYDALPDGTIIAKSVNREKGCQEEGFSAFLQCPNPTDVPPSVMVAIDSKTLKVLAQITLPEMVAGRITSTVYKGKSYIYLAGTSKVYRYTFSNNSFTLDPTWGPVGYLKPGQTPAPAIAPLGDYVVLQTNGTPTSTPSSVVAISQDNATQISRIDPFASSNAKNSIVPSMPSVDPVNNRIYVIDAGPGKLAAINFNQGTLSLAWSVDQTTLSFTTLIGPATARVIIGTNIPVKTFQGLKNYTTEQVVWRSAETGTELARSDYFDKMVTGILVTPGFGGLMYYLSQSGKLIALQVGQKASS
ncbi:MAG TPA: hypothetical protein VIX20_06185 [Ktedonobacteraceae bacterium]